MVKVDVGALIPLVGDVLKGRHRLEFRRGVSALPSGVPVVLVLVRNKGAVPVWIAGVGIELDGGRFAVPIPPTRLEADGPWAEFAGRAEGEDVERLVQAGRAWAVEPSGRFHHEPA